MSAWVGSNEVARIVLARTDAAVSGTTGGSPANLAPATGTGIVVSGRQSGRQRVSPFAAVTC